MKVQYSGIYKCWMCGNGRIFRSGQTPQQAVQNWLSFLKLSGRV